jgi:hypothetical protein
MSQENVEVVRRVTDVMDAEGFEAVLPVPKRLRRASGSSACRSSAESA